MSTPPPLNENLAGQNIGLSADTLVLKKETLYFAILLSVAVIGWIVLAITGVGVIYAAFGAIVAWIASGLLAARLKSESVEVTNGQLPILHSTFTEVCDHLNLKERPAFYILQHHGVLNAFASRHSGRNFVVIYTSLLEALGHDSPQVRFLIGHEIGHIRRNHILKRILLIPSLIVPLLGKAYHRACEATCDRFGLFAVGSQQGATEGLLVLAAGREAAVKVDPRAFALQHHSNRGFFVSWHELASGYPTLSQRVSNILGISDPRFALKAPRNILAYLFAPVFTLQTLVILYLVIIFGSIALPAFQKAKQKAKEAQERARIHQSVFSSGSLYQSR